MNALAPAPKDTDCRDLGFWELYARWVQYAAFLPMFRSHGTDAAREIWRFGDQGNPFYDTIAKYIRLRYQFIPYINSLAAQVTQSGRAMLRAVALDFPGAVATHYLTDKFLFGPALLVCPVTAPMYYGQTPNPLPIRKGASKSICRQVQGGSIFGRTKSTPASKPFPPLRRCKPCRCSSVPVQSCR